MVGKTYIYVVLLGYGMSSSRTKLMYIKHASRMKGSRCNEGLVNAW